MVEELVATQVLMAETFLNTALNARDETENAQVACQVNAIDTELRRIRRRRGAGHLGA